MWLAFRALTSIDDAAWRHRPSRWHYLSTLHKAPSVKPRGLSPGLFQVSETECTWGTSE